MALIASVKLRIYAKCWRHIFQRCKYIVLLPEVPEDTSETNSLLRKSKSPLFAELTTEHCINAIGKLAIEHDSKIHEFQEKLQDLEIPKNVQNVILPLDQFSASLDYAWGVLKLLNTVRHDAYTAEAYKKLHTRVLRAKRERYFYPSIYHAFKELKADEKTYTEPVQRIINKFLLESQLSGVDLPDRKKKHFKTAFFEIEKNIGEYRKKLAKVTNNFSHTLTCNDNIDELPSNLLRSTALDPMNYSKGPWKITLAPHVYQCFLEHCSDRVLRQNIWRANVTRASAESGRALNNSINIEEIRHHRQELAGLLGFKTFADMSMKTKMAGSVENAMTMIHTLHAKSKYATLNELTALQDFAVKHGFQHDLQLWDIPFWQRLHKQDLFKLDEAAVCQYFPFPTVLKGLFKFCEQMFDIKIMEKTSEVETWDESVTYYKIYDQSGKYLSAFYLDPYTRPKSKLLGSYMEIGRNRSNVADDEPLSYLILNFDPPQFGKPTLLSFTDVNVLLQKFGHVLQHSLTTVPYSDVAGLKNLEWDVVDVVPHFFTHWLKHYNTVAQLSGHVDTGASIPIEIHQRLQKAQKHMASLRLTEQLYLSALDLDLYTSKNFWLDVMRRNWNQYIPFPIEKFQGHLCSFPKIFCEEYPAAYFSFVWSEMIAADIFSAFKEVGLDDKEAVKEVAIRFRDTYLALGGGSQAGEVFRKFRGRDPSTEALLSINGISKHTEIQS